MTSEEKLKNLKARRNTLDDRTQRMKQQAKGLDPATRAAKDHKVAIKQQTELLDKLNQEIEVLNPTPAPTNPS